MTESQLKWASQHDWYVGHGTNVENELFIRVRIDYVTTQDFTDFQALRAWAGYGPSK